MNAKTQALVDAALALPDAERVTIIERLLESLPQDGDARVRAMGSGELDRHLAEFERTAGAALPWTKIASLARLGENWDGNGSPPLQPVALATAIRLLLAMSGPGLPAPHICPVSGGGVGITWHKKRRKLEIEVLPGGSIEYVTTTWDDAAENATTREGQLMLEQSDGAQQQLAGLADWLING